MNMFAANKKASVDRLKFQEVDLDNFDFFKFTDESPAFTGMFRRRWTTEEVPSNKWLKGSAKVKGLEFEEYGTGERKLLSENFALVKYFCENEDASIDFENDVFQIVFDGYRDLKNGQKVARFKIYRAAASEEEESGEE